MDQPCYKCGQTVEQGIPFCPHCGAPQIRVMIPEPIAASPVTSDSVTLPTDAEGLNSRPPVIPGAPVGWAHSLRPCALAAMVAALLMALGLNPFVAMLSVGFLAVVFNRQHRPGSVLNAVTGAKLGALSGLLWFGMASILEGSIVMLMHRGGEIRSELISRIQQAASQTSDPQTLAMFERFKTPGGLEFLMLFGLIFGFIAAIVLSGVGGALGAVIFGRRDHR
jgi:hypothetical protein